MVHVGASDTGKMIVYWNNGKKRDKLSSKHPEILTNLCSLAGLGLIFSGVNELKFPDMGLVARKHYFVACEHQKRSSVCASAQLDQRLHYFTLKLGY